jgi:predicted nucleic-acid-binding protein
VTNTKHCSIDTNVLVRYIARDDKIQTDIATRLIETDGFKALITIPVLIETIWVLLRLYAIDKKQIVHLVGVLLYSGQFSLQNMTAVESALEQYKLSTADFSDCLIIALSKKIGAPNMPIYSFDKQATKAGMSKIEA